MTSGREAESPYAGTQVVRAFPSQQHAGALLPLDERARRQVRVKQLNMQKAMLAMAARLGKR